LESVVKKKISIGDTFGSLIVVLDFGRDRGMVVWACECDCGATTLARADRLRNGERVDCGCGVAFVGQPHET
jgi:hypothetical protein